MAQNQNLLDQLNPQQGFAVTHTDGPMLILAGAGSGKTRTITHKIAYLIEQRICAPQNILAVTFTNKAAEEMKGRVEQLVDQRLQAAPLICTFHSLGVRILRRNASLIGYSRDFTICDTDDQKRLLKQIYKELGLSDKELPLQKSLSVISKARNQGKDANAYLNTSRDFDAPVIHEVFSAYVKALKRANAMDFDDLILLTVRLLKEEGEVREWYGKWFQYLLIDEYQDTNAPQYELIRCLTSVHQNISAVGDEDQSIYGFRGADISNILRFEQDFPGATIVKLEQNYRSTQNILDAATAVVSNNLRRKGKVLWTEQPQGDLIRLYIAEDAAEEAEYIARRIYQNLQQGVEGVAILYRTNFQSRQFEEALRRLNIKYRLVGGVSFYHRKEVKDAIAYLRVARNPDDEVSLTRIINEPSRGIGAGTAGSVFELSRDRGISFWQAIRSGLQENLFPARGHLALQKFVGIVEKCQKALEKPLHMALDTILNESGYISALREEGSEEADSRILNLEELITVAEDYEDESEPLQSFLDHAALRSDIDDYDARAPVTLMTLHNAKGLEFPIVYLAGCEEGLFPHSRSIEEDDLEEERRICYVGLTRAQQQLQLSYCRRRRFYGRQGNELNKPSRFLSEIPVELIEPTGGRRELERSYETPSFLASALSNRPSRPYGGKTYNSVESVQDFLKDRKKPKRERGLVSGALIVHEKFGTGKVLSVEPKSDGDVKVTVKFPGKGIKKMLQRYANLKPL